MAWGVSDFLGGLQSRRLPVLSVVAVTYPFGLLLIAPLAVAAGADVLVAGSAIFNDSESVTAAMNRLRTAIAL